MAAEIVIAAATTDTDDYMRRLGWTMFASNIPRMEAVMSVLDAFDNYEHVLATRKPGDFYTVWVSK